MQNEVPFSVDNDRFEVDVDGPPTEEAMRRMVELLIQIGDGRIAERQAWLDRVLGEDKKESA